MDVLTLQSIRFALHALPAVEEDMHDKHQHSLPVHTPYMLRPLDLLLLGLEWAKLMPLWQKAKAVQECGLSECSLISLAALMFNTYADASARLEICACGPSRR